MLAASGMSGACFILNSSAGGGYDERWLTRNGDALGGLGSDTRVMLACGGDEILKAARAAVSGGCSLLVAAGGDGTVSAVASQLVNSGVALGVLPMGTLNHFAKDLGIPLDPVQALRTVIEGQTTTVDVGEVNGHFFVNNSSLGLYPDIVRQRELLRSRLGHGKWGAFAWATLAALKRFPFLNVKLSLEGQQRLHRTPFVFVGNGEYLMQGLQVGTRARLTDGRLCVYLAGQGGRLDLLKLAVAALFGRLKQARDFCALQAREIVIETPRSRLRVATDGEVRLLGTPLTYRIHPHALRVVVPAVRG